MKVSTTKVDKMIQVDITAPDKGVQVETNMDGTIIWVNVDGICVLRVCQIPQLTVQVADTYPFEFNFGKDNEENRSG